MPPTGKVGDHMVPMPHFGLVLDVERFRALADRLGAAGVEFVIPPTLRFCRATGRAMDHVLPRPIWQPDRGEGLCQRRSGVRVLTFCRHPVGHTGADGGKGQGRDGG